MSRQSVAKAHEKIQELAWEPLYHEPVSQYGTDYTFQKAKKKDPLKQVLRSYFPMQEEKDHRVYGASDGAIRGNMFRQVEERWLEWQKLFLSIIPLPEISAARAMPLLFRTVPNPELHNGQAIQMIDEVRHSTIQQNLKRLYMNNYIDPAGFNSSLRSFQNDYCGTIGRQFAEGFITGDAITAASIYLTIVAETAFTNTLFVAMPAEAAANGDYLLPTVFHSVQSDESRHISNGYATLLMALADEGNHQLLERDLRYAWWNNHRVVDAAIGTFIEYGTKDRRKDRESYAEMWRRWIYDDYYRSYLVPLEKYGLVIPHDLIEEAWNQIWNKGYVHEVAQFFCTGWLANYWRMDPMTDKDFEWFEYKYPGWYDKYGAWWENYNRLSMPNGHHPIVAEDVNYQYPHRCWTCMVPCLVREDMVMAEVDGQMRTYCHEACRWTDVEAFRPTYQGRQTPNMGQLIGKREWETLYHGWNWADVVSDMGNVREDGKTLVAQPHLNLDPKKMWTLDHLRRMPAAAEPERAAQRDDPRGAAGVPRRLHPRWARPGVRHLHRAETRPRRQRRRRRGRRRCAASSALPDRTAEGTMADTHKVRFEPVGIEIDVDEEKTVLRAATEQGLMLMHGCKEGQCAACKSFVLDGDDIELDRYSTFALPDYEKEEGYTLLCRAHVYEDVTIELLNYDEEMIHSGLPIQTVHAEVVSNELVTPDMHSLVLRLVEPTELAFFPGQYVDLTVPGTETTRSFSIANTSSKESGQLEFVIRAYPDGEFSQLPGGRAGRRRADRRRRPVRGVHPAGEPRRATWCSSAAARGWRRSCPSCAPSPSGAAPARPPTTTAPGAAATSASRRSSPSSRRTCPTSTSCRPSPSRTRRPGRARSASSPTSCAVTRRTSATSTATSAGRRRWSRRPWRRSATWGRPTSASTTTSSRRPHRPDQTTTERRVSDDHHPGAQSSPSALHRRRGRREGVPRLDRAQLQLLHPEEAPAVALRGRDRRGAARPPALPEPGVALRLLERRGGLPAGVDGPQGVGLGPAGARAVPRVRRQGLPVAGHRVARVPRPQRGVGAHALPLQRQRGAPDQPEHRDGPSDQGVRAVEPQLGPRSWSGTSARGCTSSRDSGCTCSPTPTVARPRTCTTTRSR